MLCNFYYMRNNERKIKNKTETEARIAFTNENYFKRDTIKLIFNILALKNKHFYKEN